MIVRVNVVVPNGMMTYFIGMRTDGGIIERFTDEYIEGVRVVKAMNGDNVLVELVGVQMIITYTK